MQAGLAVRLSQLRSFAMLGFGAAALAACASIERTPAQASVAELVKIDHTCRAEDGKLCKAEEQPKKVLIEGMQCSRLPLRAGVPEVSRAECLYEATIIRVDGEAVKLGPRIAEFGLLNYSPGARLGVYQWSKKPDRPATPAAAKE